MQRLRHDQKVRIAQCLLLAKQIKENGLEGIAAGQVSRGDVHTADGVVEQITEGYTYEAGGRWVERELGKVCRAKAVEFSRARQDGTVRKCGTGTWTGFLESPSSSRRSERNSASRAF